MNRLAHLADPGTNQRMTPSCDTSKDIRTRPALEWLPLSVTALALGRAPKTLTTWLADGDFPDYVRLPNGQIRIQRDDLQSFAWRRGIPLRDEEGDRCGATRRNQNHRFMDSEPVTDPIEEAPHLWLSVRSLGRHLDVSSSTLYKWLREGDFPDHVRLRNRQVRVHVDDADAWMRSKKVVVSKVGGAL